MNDRAWNELLHEFRALGGTADNIRLGVGSLGRGLFPADPTKPVLVRVPESLLVRSKNIVFPNGSPRVAPGALVGARERAWLDRYLDEFSWNGGGCVEVERMFDMAQALPSDLRHRLVAEFRCGSWFQEMSDDTIQKHFLRARGIDYAGGNVIPPILECANHGAAPGFDLENGLSLAGNFAPEVLVSYSDLDAFGIFQAWGFAFPSPVALSIALKGAIQSVLLSIGRQRFSVDPSRGGWVPRMARENGEQKMSFLLLGHERYPRLAKGMFYSLMKDAGYAGAEECFAQIQQANRAHFLALKAAVTRVNAPMARTLQAMAEYQLRALDFALEYP